MKDGVEYIERVKERYGGGRKRGERRVGERGREGGLGGVKERGELEREMVCEGVEREGKVKDAKVEGEMTRLGIRIGEMV